MFENGNETSFKYDDAGERVIKRSKLGEIVYVNSFFTIRNREVGTKNVYAGTTRLVSKMMKQDKPGSKPTGSTPLEKDQSFYHADHLGSSNYVTTADGTLSEHLEYFPYGETWVQESSNTQKTPGLFASKELDDETGLYYFGARYYDPRTSMWQSADPILSGLLTSADSPRKLATYGYSRQNPVRFGDPDGCDYRDYIPGTKAGEEAAQYWADLAVQGERQGGLAGGTKQAVGWTFGIFASLWTRETAADTALILGTAGLGAAAAAGKLGAASVPIANSLAVAGSFQTGVSAGEAATGTSITGRQLSTPERVSRGTSAALGFASLGKGAIAEKAFTPYWRYTGPGSNPNSRWLTRGSEPPYGTNYGIAEDALQIPPMSRPITGVQEAQVPWWKPVSGPRPATGHSDWGKGGGSEWYQGWDFPD